MTTTNSKQSKNYTYSGKDVTITAQGVQSTGENAGRPYVIGHFKAKVKGGKEVTKGFKAFDRLTKTKKVELTPASNLLSIIAAGGTEAVFTGSFQEGRARDAADASKGNFSDLIVGFVQTPAARAEFVAAQKAAREAATVEAQSGVEGSAN